MTRLISVLLALTAALFGQTLRFNDGMSEMKLRLATDEVAARAQSQDAVASALKKAIPGATVEARTGDRLILRVPPAAGTRQYQERLQAIRALSSVKDVAPVLYDIEAEPSASRLAKMTPEQRTRARNAARRIVTAKVLVKTADPTQRWQRFTQLYLRNPTKATDAKDYYLLT